jgi:hypothetical protein
MGDWFGGHEEEQTYQEPMYYPNVFTPSVPPGPSFTPYQQLSGGGYGAGGLLNTGSIPQTNSPGFVPTGGWTGAGNANIIPGAAYQLLRMSKSPLYTW